MSEIAIIKGYLPGAMGRVVELHGTYYHEHWGFGLFFEAKVAREMTEFMLRYHEGRDGFWCAVEGGRVEGSLTVDGIDAEGKGAHLRWFILSETCQGRGIGRQLLETAVAFCRERAFPRMYLWTFEGLHAARRLYEKSGFVLMEERRGTQWGKEVSEQRFELLFS